MIILRHGETAAPELLHGAESDVALGARGRAQALEAADWLRQAAPDLLYSSVMRRARETAEVVGAAIGVSAGLIEGIHERRMGPLSGSPRTEGLAEHRRILDCWAQGNLDERGEDGESYAELRGRLAAALIPVLDAARGRTIAVVGHGVAIQVFLTSFIEGMTYADLPRIGIGFLARNELVWSGALLKPVWLNGEPFAGVSSDAEGARE